MRCSNEIPLSLVAVVTLLLLLEIFLMNISFFSCFSKSFCGVCSGDGGNKFEVFQFSLSSFTNGIMMKRHVRLTGKETFNCIELATFSKALPSE